MENSSSQAPVTEWDADGKPIQANSTPDISQTMVTPSPKGLVSPGNLPIWNRPSVQNADGTHSSEYSTSREDDDGHEVLVPTVVNGKFLTPSGKKPDEGGQQEQVMFDKAWQHYKDTGEHLGKFDNSDNADAYANVLHNRGSAPPPTAPAATEWDADGKPITPSTALQSRFKSVIPNPNGGIPDSQRINSPSSEQVVQQETGITPSDHPVVSAFQGAGRAIKNVAGGLIDTMESPFELGAPGRATAALVDNATKAHSTAEQLRAGGHPIQAAGAELGALPIVGPIGQELGERAAAGDKTGAVAEGLTTALLPKAAEEVGGRISSRFPSNQATLPGENFTDYQHRALSGVLARATGMGDNFIPQDVASGAGSALRQSASDNPSLVRAVHEGTPQDAMGATQALLDKAKQKIDIEHQSTLAPVASQPADMSPVISKVTFPKSLEGFSPEDAAAIKDLRTRLSSVKTLDGMNELRMYLNKELAPDFRKNAIAAGRSGAVDSAMSDALSAVRNAYYDQLEKATGQDFSVAKRTEGQMMAAQEALQKMSSGLTKKEALATEPKSAKALAADALQGGRTIHGGPVAGTANLVAERVLGQTPMAQVQSGLQRFFTKLPDPSPPGAVNIPRMRGPLKLPSNVPANAQVGGPPAAPPPFTGGSGSVPSVITPEPTAQPRLPAQAGPNGVGVPPPSPLVAAPPPEPRTIPLPPRAGQPALPSPSGVPDFVRPSASPSPPLNPATAATGTRTPLAPNPTPAMPTGMTATPEGIRVNRPMLPAPLVSPKGKTVGIGDEISAKGRTGKVTGVNPKTGKVIVKWQ